MPKLTIDGQTVEVPAGTTILQAARQLKLMHEVPTFCYHPGLSIAGNCRMCLVEVEKAPKPVASCATPVAEGMVVHVMGEKAVAARKAVIEFLLSNHPLDCPICDRAGECVLQDNSMQEGLLQSRFAPKKINKPKVQDIGPHVVLDAERCIMCSRCVRFVDEVTHTHELGIFGRGNSEQIGLAPGKRLDNAYSGNVVDLCPVGALTAKEFRFQSRAWFLHKTESVCPSCARGCSITVETNESRINKVGQKRVYRLMPRENPHVNRFWMCDEGRFRFGFVDENRLVRSVAREAGRETVLTFQEAIEAFKRELDTAHPERTGVLLSRGSTLEDLFLARELFQGHHGKTDVATDAPADRPPSEDGFLIHPDKWPNSAGAILLGYGDHGHRWVEVLDDAEHNRLDLLVVVGHDLMRIAPMAQIEDVLHRVKRMVYVGPNATAGSARANLVIPTATFAERDGTWVNADGRLQRFHKALEPLGDAVPEWRIWRDLLGRYGTPFLATDEAAVFKAAASSIPQLKGLTYDAIGSHGVALKNAALKRADRATAGAVRS